MHADAIQWIRSSPGLWMMDSACRGLVRRSGVALPRTATLARYASRSTQTPRLQTAMMARVAVMSAVGSPSMSSRSARRPRAILPRSANPKHRAATEVAAASAAAGVSPAWTSRAS